MMAEISSGGMPFSDAGSWTYSFNEPFERVRKVLNSMGFGFDKAGNQPRDPLEDHVWAQLSVYEGMTVLICEPRGTLPTLEESDKIAAALRQAEASKRQQ
jgi:hypothetical protein